jgi:hypothetical protein
MPVTTRNMATQAFQASFIAVIAPRQPPRPAASSPPADDPAAAAARTRRRKRNQRHERVPRADNSLDPQTFTIDLSLAPRKRYVALARAHRTYLARLVPLFEEVVAGNPLGLSPQVLALISRRMLTRLHDDEQTEELRGISEAVGAEMWLLVAYNVLLDLFMGCTSGGARVKKSGGGSKMVHFRTLDWGMEALRLVVVKLEFVERVGGPVVAECVTYVGFVGMLTGVRYVFSGKLATQLTGHSKGLSVSLNFRAQNNASTRRGALLYYAHQASVLLGYSPSISSRLRHMIIPPRPVPKPPARTWSLWGQKKEQQQQELPTYESLLETLPSIPTTSCYITLCNGQEAAVIEKDRVTATTRTSKYFVSVTNHDVSTENAQRKSKRPAAGADDPTGMQTVLDESYDRRDQLEARYKTMIEARRYHVGSRETDRAISLKEVKELVVTFPTSNESTHFATVMDPTEGEIKFVRWWRNEMEYGQ